jgi:hypothetical protein
MPCLLTSAKTSKKFLLRKTTNTRNKPGKKLKERKPLNKTATYKWLNCLRFYVTKEKKDVYVNGHKKANIIKYRQNDFLPQIAHYTALSMNYKEDASDVLQPILPILSFKEKKHVIYYHNKSCFHVKKYFKRI